MLIPLADRASELGAEIGIIGGSGLYELVEDPVTVTVTTPFGDPASPPTVGTLGGQRVAFVPRHGHEHRYAAHRVPYQANIWALASLGVREVVAPCSCGALQPELEPGDFVVVDQLVDRTFGRPGTFHDTGAPDDHPGADQPLHHQHFADPYDERIRRALLDASRHHGVTTTDGGTMVIINGPRFSTRAESQWYRDQGWSVVNMTGAPEAALAAEAGLAYATVALVTDRDAAVDGGDPVTMDAVLEVMRRNVQTLRGVLATTVDLLAS